MDAQWKDGSSFKHRWAELCHRAGIHDLNFHDLRHRAASWLLEAGIDYAVIEKLLVHRLHGMGEGYIHNWEHRLREAVRNLEAIVARKLSDTAQEIGKGVGSCGQLGSYENFEFPKWWILWCRGTESNCRHQPFQGQREIKEIRGLGWWPSAKYGLTAPRNIKALHGPWAVVSQWDDKGPYTCH